MDGFYFSGNEGTRFWSIQRSHSSTSQGRGHVPGGLTVEEHISLGLQGGVKRGLE